MEPLESVRFVLQVLQEFRDIGVRIGFISEAIGNIIDDEGTYMHIFNIRMYVKIIHGQLFSINELTIFQLATKSAAKYYHHTNLIVLYARTEIL